MASLVPSNEVVLEKKSKKCLIQSEARTTILDFTKGDS
jgi:hypothetical protein